MSDVPEETMQELAAEREKLVGQMGGEKSEPEQEQPGGEEPEQERQDGEPNTTDPDMDDFMTYEEYVEAGYDPEFYRGPKAHKHQKQILKEKKDLEQKVKKLDDQMLQLQKHHDQQLKQKQEEIGRLKKQAKEEFDFDRYEELEKEERELERQQNAQQEQASAEHPVIAQFREENPKFNPASPEYDPVDEAAFKAAYNAMVQSVAQRKGDLTDDDIKSCLEATRKRFSGSQQGKERQQPKHRSEPPKRPTQKKDPVEKLPAEVKDLYERWSKSQNPEKQAYAKQLLEQNKGAE